MTPEDMDRRIIKSRRALVQWRHERSLPTGDSPLIASVATTEIAVLEHLRRTAPADRHETIDALIDRWRELA